MRLFVFAVGLLLLYWVSPIRPAYTFDVSLPYKWWMEIRWFGYVKKGDYVSFKPPIENHYTKNKVLVKEVACDEGEYLYVRGLDYYCQGQYLGRARETDSQGNPVSPFIWNDRIPKGYFFALGENERSYDSRYMGLIPKENVIALMIPLAKSPDLDFIFLRR